MRILGAIIVFLTITVSFAAHSAIQPIELPMIDPLSIKDHLTEGDQFVIIDVRPLADFEIGHIRGALSADIPAFQKFLPKSKLELIVIYDDKGTSFKVESFARKLKKLGYKDVKVLKGGLGSWTTKKLPMISG